MEAPSRRERNKTAKRRRIFEAAVRLISKRGFDRVTVDEIVDRADVAKGTFFNYFPEKNDILFAFWAEVSSEVLDYGSKLRGRSARRLFHRFFRHLAERVHREERMFEALTRAIATSRELQAVERDMVPRVTSVYGRFLQVGMENGELRKGLDVRVVSEAVGDLWIGTLRKWVYRARAIDLFETVAPKLDLLIDGLADHPVSPPRTRSR